MVRDNMITLTSGGRRPPHREDENQESQRRPEPDLRGHDQHERLGVLSEFEHPHNLFWAYKMLLLILS